MMSFYDLNLFLYNLSIFPVVFFSTIMMILVVLNLFSNRKSPDGKAGKIGTPFVTVQIPVFNDPVAVRCVKKCMNFDYPRDRYEILIVDDSTDRRTRKLLQALAEKNRGFVKYVHRDTRSGFKSGAYNNALKFTKGEFVIIFDSDFVPRPDFLKKILQPFSDPKVAIVQSRPSFYNEKANFVTRFASYMQMIHHNVLMPLNHKANSVMFCGSVGALRKEVIEKVGGWNVRSITEDSDISLKILLEGYKSVYLDFETPGEVPETLEGFVKQQMRWCYGTTRVFLDNISSIFFNRNLNLGQRAMISYMTLGNVAVFFIGLMTFFGSLGWFFGDTVFSISSVFKFFRTFFLTSGFLLLGFFTLLKQKKLSEFPMFVFYSMTLGILLVLFNSIALFKAVLKKSLGWFCTPKAGNESLKAGV